MAQADNGAKLDELHKNAKEIATILYRSTNKERYAKCIAELQQLIDQKS